MEAPCESSLFSQAEVQLLRNTTTTTLRFESRDFNNPQQTISRPCSSSEFLEHQEESQIVNMPPPPSTTMGGSTLDKSESKPA